MNLTGVLLTDFVSNIRQKKLFIQGDYLLIGVSGGVDSLVLCELCSRAGYNFEMAHANFQLRNDESERDERFVRGLAKKYNVPIHVKRFDTSILATNRKTSVQETARTERYQWFNEILTALTNENIKHQKKYILTAHHLDDNIETMLMHFFRGTGIHGLRGMLPKQSNVIRPLLSFRKNAILTFAREQQLEWVEDSSNAEEKYSRNYFRNKLLPLVRNIYQEVDQNLALNLDRMYETEIIYNEAIALHKKKLVEENGNEIYLPVEKLKAISPLNTVLHEIISPYGFTAHQTDDVKHLLTSETGRYVESSTHRIFKNRKRLVIAPKEIKDASVILIEKEQHQQLFSGGKIVIESHNRVHEIPQEPGIAMIDKRFIVFPLILRKWKAGDYFYPLGMNKKKKLARFLIDIKLSKTDKEKIWVLETESKILWVVGKRIDDRFKISDSTKNIVQFQYTP